MMPFVTRVLSLLLIAATTQASAAESTTDARDIEILPGETVFFQLANSLSFEVGPIIRVDNPSRTYSVVKATFDVDAGGAGRLKLRNGYDESLSFQMNAACATQGRSGLLTTLRPGVEAAMPVQAPAKKIVLCNFALVRVGRLDENSWLMKGVLDNLRDLNRQVDSNEQQE